MTAAANPQPRAVDLRGRTLFVGTPMYDGRCLSEYTFAMVQLSALCVQLGVALRCFFACHEALIAAARNATADAFLRSECDHLMFIDADIGFDPRDVIRLLAMQASDGAAGYDVLAAPYPLKRIVWDQLHRAAKAGIDPERLSRVASPVAVHPVDPGAFAPDQPLEVTQAGTGFMLIRRATFERLHQTLPRPTYRARGIGIEVDAGERIVAYFDTTIERGAREVATHARALLSRDPHASAHDVLASLDAMAADPADAPSEDYAFCRAVRAAGMRVWLCPWMELSHTGDQRFVSRLADLAAIG